MPQSAPRTSSEWRWSCRHRNARRQPRGSLGVRLLHVTAPWSVVGLVGRRQAGRSSTLSVSPHGALTRLPPRVQACQPSACRRARQGAANRPFAGLRRSTALRSTPCAMLCGASNPQTTVLGVTPCVHPECGERAVTLASYCSGSSCESPTRCTRPLQSQLAKPAALRHSMRHAHSSTHRTVATGSAPLRTQAPCGPCAAIRRHARTRRAP